MPDEVEDPLPDPDAKLRPYLEAARKEKIKAANENMELRKQVADLLKKLRAAQAHKLRLEARVVKAEEQAARMMKPVAKGAARLSPASVHVVRTLIAYAESIYEGGAAE